MLKKIVVSGVVLSKNSLVLLVAIVIWDQIPTRYMYIYALVYYNKVRLSTLSSVRRLVTSITQCCFIALVKAIDISLPP